MKIGAGWIVKGAAAFTLLEVLLAVTILGMAYLAIMQNFSMSMRNIDRVARNAERTAAARDELERHFMVGDIREDVDGEVFAEGNKYVVVRVADEESGKLVTLCLKEL
ncbi:MAG: type II secretion system GspH family protein [Desulfobulbaceae bacterium]|nr:type II secretion system GspH family protein [Desulfobulbaceae bacterium]